MKEVSIKKFFYMAKKRFNNFPFETLEEFEEHLGPRPFETNPVLINKDKPTEKKYYRWGTWTDEMAARRRRKKIYIWKN